MLGADISVNSSNPALKNRQNRALAYHNLLFANKSFDDIFWEKIWTCNNKYLNNIHILFFKNYA
jgi:hypothetical protein